MWGTTVIAFAEHGMGASHRAPRDDDTVGRGAAGRRGGARAALSACVRAGEVRRGCALRLRYAIMPGHEHYNCTIDMLCRVGWLPAGGCSGAHRDYADDPACSVGIRIAGCQSYGNVELAEVAVHQL